LNIRYASSLVRRFTHCGLPETAGIRCGCGLLKQEIANHDILPAGCGNMRLASLYSGGKDSAFSLYVAEQMGHDIPYIVNIKPKKESWIFHVPNQSAVPMAADALGKKIICAETGGSEKDDMDALEKALDGLDIEGIVTGAVWSDYQWEKINLVCGKLGLKVISPLWRKDQDLILNEIIDSGIKAIIVGAYADGFDESWLGRELDGKTASELREIRERHKISVIGEGGEYESLALDSPLQSFALSVISREKEWKNGSGTLFVECALIPK
jgi:ABC transporter with metal-binding/Fe-S-binding domain ATP-binding protein